MTSTSSFPFIVTRAATTVCAWCATSAKFLHRSLQPQPSTNAAGRRPSVRSDQTLRSSPLRSRFRILGAPTPKTRPKRRVRDFPRFYNHARSSAATSSRTEWGCTSEFGYGKFERSGGACKLRQEAVLREPKRTSFRSVAFGEVRRLRHLRVTLEHERMLFMVWIPASKEAAAGALRG